MILFTSDVEFDGFRMVFDELLCIADDEGEVTTTTGTGHLQGKDFGDIAVMHYRFGDVAIGCWLLAIGHWLLVVGHKISRLDHAGEHSGLGIEGGAVGGCKGIEVFLHDSCPAGVSGIGQGLDLGGGDVLVLDNGAAGLAGLHGYHHEVLFEEAEGHLIGGVLDLSGPEVIVVVVTAEAGNADADGVLRTGDVAILTLGIVLEAEDEAGERLGIHLGELHGPYLLDHLTRRGAQATTVAHLEGGLQGDGEGPAGMVLADVGLVDPGAGEIQPCWNTAIGRWLLAIGLLGAEGCLEGAGAAGLQACMGGALELDVLDTALLAELTLGVAAALGIDDEDVGLDEVQGGEEVDDSPTLVDIGFLDGLDVLNHEQALFLGEHGLAVLVLKVGGIGTDAYIELTKL